MRSVPTSFALAALVSLATVALAFTASCGSTGIAPIGNSGEGGDGEGGGSRRGSGVEEGGAGCASPFSGLPCQNGDGGPPPAAAPFACGTGTCGVEQYCLEECCGGVGPLCLPAND